MSRLYPLLITLLFSAFQSVNADPASSVHQSMLNDYHAKQVAPHTWVVHGPDRAQLKENLAFVNNPAFVISDQSIIVIDPGSSVQIGRALLAHIRKLTNKPITHVLNTHIHGDHWLGNHAFFEANPKVKVYGHPMMLKKAKAGAASQWLETFTNLTDGAIKGTKIVLPNQTLTDQQVITVDNLHIKVHLSDHAHTQTDAMFEVMEDNLLFTGDTVNNQRIVPFESGSFKGSIKAIEHAMTLKLSTVVPGHGATTNAKVLAAYKSGMASIYQTAKTLIEEDMEPYEMKDQALANAKAFKGWMGLEEEIGRYLITAVLEAEQDDF